MEVNFSDASYDVEIKNDAVGVTKKDSRASEKTNLENTLTKVGTVVDSLLERKELQTGENIKKTQGITASISAVVYSKGGMNELRDKVDQLARKLEEMAPENPDDLPPSPGPLTRGTAYIRDENPRQ